MMFNDLLFNYITVHVKYKTVLLCVTLHLHYMRVVFISVTRYINYLYYYIIKLHVECAKKIE